ncbi:hypothetical protein P7C70_g2821, partial [Phenoliferia sp. Uapishka_3]
MSEGRSEADYQRRHPTSLQPGASLPSYGLILSLCIPNQDHVPTFTVNSLSPNGHQRADSNAFEIIPVHRISMQSCTPQRSTSLRVLQHSASGRRPRRASQPARYPPSGSQGRDAIEKISTNVELGRSGMDSASPISPSDQEVVVMEATTEGVPQGAAAMYLQSAPPTQQNYPYGMITPPSSEVHLSSSPERPVRSPLRLAREGSTSRHSTASVTVPVASRPTRTPSYQKRRISNIPSSGAKIFEAPPDAPMSPGTPGDFKSTGSMDPLGEGRQGGSRWPAATYPRINRSGFVAPRPPSERYESGPLLESRSKSMSYGNRLSLPAPARQAILESPSAESFSTALEEQRPLVPAYSRSPITMSLVRPGLFDEGVRFGYLSSSHFTGGPALFFPRIIPISSGDNSTSRFVIEARSWGALLKVIGSYSSTIITASSGDSGVDPSAFTESSLTLDFLLDPSGKSLVRLSIFLPRNLLSLSQDLTCSGASTSALVSSPLTTFALPSHPILPFPLGSLAATLTNLRTFADIAGSTNPGPEPTFSYEAMRSLNGCLKSLDTPKEKVGEERKVGKLRKLMRSKSLKVLKR